MTKCVDEGPESIKLMRKDCMDMPDFEDGSFDSIVSTFTLNSCYDREAMANEMIRLCKKEGHILILERGASYLPPYNHWLAFRAA
jgi:ubiquinone/menaquinone biosynthesis C-methylase UbiE